MFHFQCGFNSHCVYYSLMHPHTLVSALTSKIECVSCFHLISQECRYIHSSTSPKWLDILSANNTHNALTLSANNNFANYWNNFQPPSLTPYSHSLSANNPTKFVCSNKKMNSTANTKQKSTKKVYTLWPDCRWRFEAFNWKFKISEMKALNTYFSKRVIKCKLFSHWKTG